MQNETKYLDDFNHCSTIISVQDEDAKTLFSHFCTLLGISELAGRLLFWLIANRSTDCTTNATAQELGVSIEAIHTELENLHHKRFIDKVSEYSVKDSYDITDASIKYAQNLYCFQRLLTD